SRCSWIAEAVVTRRTALAACGRARPPRFSSIRFSMSGPFKAIDIVVYQLLEFAKTADGNVLHRLLRRHIGGRNDALRGWSAAHRLHTRPGDRRRRGRSIAGRISTTERRMHRRKAGG